MEGGVKHEHSSGNTLPQGHSYMLSSVTIFKIKIVIPSGYLQKVGQIFICRLQTFQKPNNLDELLLHFITSLPTTLETQQLAFTIHDNFSLVLFLNLKVIFIYFIFGGTNGEIHFKEKTLQEEAKGGHPPPSRPKNPHSKLKPTGGWQHHWISGHPQHKLHGGDITSFEELFSLLRLESSFFVVPSFPLLLSVCFIL